MTKYTVLILHRKNEKLDVKHFPHTDKAHVARLINEVTQSWKGIDTKREMLIHVASQRLFEGYQKYLVMESLAKDIYVIFKYPGVDEYSSRGDLGYYTQKKRDNVH